jgi:hypothetical protein
MATTATPYSSILSLMAGTGMKFMSGTAMVALTTDAYTPSQTGHVWMSDITNELSDPSYERQVLTSKAQAYSSGTLSLSCADTTFPALVAPVIRRAVFYMLGTTDADSPLIGYWDLGTNQAADVNDFKLIYHLAGFLNISL